MVCGMNLGYEVKEKSRLEQDTVCRVTLFRASAMIRDNTDVGDRVYL